MSSLFDSLGSAAGDAAVVLGLKNGGRRIQKMTLASELRVLWKIPLIIIVVFFCSLTYGKVLYVDNNGTGANDGMSWANSYLCLQGALAAARPGDEIQVAEGIYKPDRHFVRGRSPRVVASGNRTDTFQLINGVTIKGGYAGFGEPDPSARDVDLYETILSGDLNGDDGPGFTYNAENSYHVVTGSGTNETAVLEGFTVTAGNANGSSPNQKGGGMDNDAGSPTLLNCTFNENSATTGGGMSNARNSGPTVIDCTFSGNSAANNGGGMRNNSSNPMVSNCTFNGNSANRGGGMNNHSGDPSVANCTFTGNSANDKGGGMNSSHDSHPSLSNCTFNGNYSDSGGATYNDNSSPTLTDCTFSGNLANKGGGAINNWQSSPTLTNCTFSNNSAGWGGGAIDNVSWDEYTESSPTLTNCTFSGNSAGWDGGGMENVSSHPTLIDCIFSQNSAGEGGGGMHNDAGSPTLLNCTFSGNLTDKGGGAMDNYGQSSPTLTNCTFSGNSAEEKGGGIYNDGGNLTLLNCVFIENTSVSNGAALKLISSDATITGCRFFANMTLGGGSANAGAIGNSNSSPTINGCTFLNNSCPGFSGGAIVNYESSSPTVLNCVFQGNSAGAGGGGIFNWVSSSPLVVNCLFTGNSANRGGGMSNNKDCHPTIINCTFVGNQAQATGGGMWSRTDSGPVLSNCILWENTGISAANMGESAQIDSDESGAITVNHCDIQGLTSELGGTGNIGDRPFFVDADGVDNIIGTEDDNVRLLPGSPCIDAGDNSALPTSVLTDLDSNPRIVNGSVDIGAYEYSPTSKYMKASNPKPADGDMHAYTWVNLSWRAGNLAVSHDVYFGEDFDDVNNGVEGTFQGNQAETFFVAGFPGFLHPYGLLPDTTYYWRIDEVNDLYPIRPTKGDVWSFSIASETAYTPRHFEITYYDNYNYDTNQWDAWQSTATPLDAWDDKYAPIDPAKTVFTDHAFTSISTFDLRGNLFSKDGHASGGEDWNPLQSIGDNASGQSAHHVFAAVFKGLIYLEEGDILWVASDDDAYVFLDDETEWGQEVLSVPYISHFGADLMIVTAAQAGYHIMTVRFIERRNVHSGIEITVNGKHLRSAEVGQVLTLPGTPG